MNQTKFFEQKDEILSTGKKRKINEQIAFLNFRMNKTLTTIQKIPVKFRKRTTQYKKPKPLSDTGLEPLSTTTKG